MCVLCHVAASTESEGIDDRYSFANCFSANSGGSKGVILAVRLKSSFLFSTLQLTIASLVELGAVRSVRLLRIFDRVTH